jgi:hypothetical protein
MSVAMEILGELMVAGLQLLGEVLIQALAELGVELGLRSIREPFRKRVINPVLAGLGYLLLGAGVGGLSLLVFPSSFVAGRAARIVSLVVTPLLAGALMGALGAWRRRREQELIRMDRFGYAFAFALGMALVRFVWAQG